MAKKQDMLSTALASIKTIKSAGEDIYAGGNKTASVLVFVDKTVPKSFILAVREKLRPQTDHVVVHVRSYGDAEALSLALADLPSADLALIVAGESFRTGELITRAHTLASAVVVFTTNPAALPSQIRLSNEADQLPTVIPVPTVLVSAGKGADKKVRLSEGDFESVFDELASTVAKKLEKSRIALAQAYPFMRRAVALALTQKASLENGLVSAIAFVPGADMPVLTLNQMRLVSQIASLYGLPVGVARFKEMGAIVAGSFGARALVRAVVSRVNVAGFAVRMGVAYSATLGIGHAALELYSRQQGGQIIALPAADDKQKASKGSLPPVPSEQNDSLSPTLSPTPSSTSPSAASPTVTPTQAPSEQ
ncbi:MAG: hypothetical protein LBB42_03365 [Coriobacteriales bacterium]|jgi:uncharacterized protein (DUF697 family)|nr:hypothetical protein [Coriobacteriales bacterium]